MRLVNGQGDHLDGLTIDRYNEHFVIQYFKPHWTEHFDLIKDFFIHQFNPQYIIAKERIGRSEHSRAHPKVQILFDLSDSKTTVTEGGINFIVDLNDAMNTGLFLDMRQNRKRVAQAAHGKSVLNCFAYTCSFGVYCRSLGAKSVVNVDISRKALEWGSQNYALNNIAAGPHEFVRADALKYLARGFKKDYRFDVIVIDPPSFSRCEAQTFSVKKDLGKTIEAALKIINPGGHLFFSTNESSISSPYLASVIKRQMREQNRPWQDTGHCGQDVDFPGSGTMKESHLACVLTKIGDRS